jgi:hypothetical protein
MKKKEINTSMLSWSGQLTTKELLSQLAIIALIGAVIISATLVLSANAADRIRERERKSEMFINNGILDE